MLERREHDLKEYDFKNNLSFDDTLSSRIDIKMVNPELQKPAINGSQLKNC